MNRFREVLESKTKQKKTTFFCDLNMSLILKYVLYLYVLLYFILFYFHFTFEYVFLILFLSLSFCQCLFFLLLWGHRGEREREERIRRHNIETDGYKNISYPYGREWEWWGGSKKANGAIVYISLHILNVLLLLLLLLMSFIIHFCVLLHISLWLFILQDHDHDIDLRI